MRTGRQGEVSARLLSLGRLWPSAAVLAASFLFLALSATWDYLAAREHDRLRDALRRRHYEAALLRSDRALERELSSAVASLGGRLGRKERLQELFDPLVSPPARFGVTTREVSYQPAPGPDGRSGQAIHFRLSGGYPGLARYLASLEGGTPVLVVDNLSLRFRPDAGEQDDPVEGTVSVRAVVR